MRSFSLSTYAFFAIFLPFYFSSVEASAQYIKGYVITNRQDSLRGFIEDKNNSWREKAISFKRSLSDPAQVLSINSISGFFLEDYNELYLTHFVSIDQKPIKIRFLEGDATPKASKESVFLKQLVKGNVSLLSYNDGEREHFYMLQGEKPEELTVLRYMKDSQLAEIELYKQLLINLAKDCPTLDAKGTQFTQTALIKFFQKYNKCVSNTSYEKKKREMKVGIGLVAGGSITSISAQGLETSSSKQIEYNKSNNRFLPLIGASLDFSSRKKSNPISATFETLWRSSNISASNNKINPWLYSPREDITIKTSWLNFGIKVKYVFRRQNIVKPYAGVGVSASKLIRSSTPLKFSTDDPSDTRITDPYIKFGSLGYGAIVFGGVSFYNFYSELRCDLNIFTVPEKNAGLIFYSSGLSIGYRFKKKN